MSRKTLLTALALCLLVVPTAFAEHPGAESSAVTDFTNNIRQDNGQPITPATPLTELIREAQLLNPVLTPTGQRVTLAQWNAPTGAFQLECKKKGTVIKLEVDHLIPNGVYTLWLFTLPTGVPPSGFGGAFDLRTGENEFHSDANGHSKLQVTLPAGPLSTRGSVTNCLLDNTVVAFFGNYHIDGMSHGTSPGIPGTNAEQFSITFTQTPLAQRNYKVPGD
ncbi:MAG TPA: hypothetical protein VN851_20235 [Thermoanaerobaculia bacterium]|nr:hypothetical protein [Thermoanaerobaculia bacterium]